MTTIRVVNCLQALGKEKAIALLREITDATPIIPGLPPPITHGRDQRAVLIVPLLFEVPENGPTPPERLYDKAARRWCHEAAMLSIQGGIPFRICGDWTYGGEAPEPQPLVEWAAKHGKLRDKLLEPQDDPFEAADALYSRIRAGECWEFSQCWQVGPLDIPDSWMRDDLREQAIKMLPQSFQDRKDLSWDELRKRVARSGIHWDRDTQAYVIGDGPDK